MVSTKILIAGGAVDWGHIEPLHYITPTITNAFSIISGDPSNITDFDKSTYVEYDTQASNDMFVTYDLGSVRRYSQISIKYGRWCILSPTAQWSGAVEISKDGSTWTPVLELPATASTEEEIIDTTVTGCYEFRYIRIRTPRTNCAMRHRFYHFEVKP
ncbi:MAG: hypothetical protein JRC86_13285 [Deltaproteobacteria bacterium]|nr:hypothetical protein [Deltaproteobacteria bacterium]